MELFYVPHHIFTVTGIFQTTSHDIHNLTFSSDFTYSVYYPQSVDLSIINII